MKFDESSQHATNDILHFILRGHMIDIIEISRYPAIHALLRRPWNLYSPPSLKLLELCKEMLLNCVYRIDTNGEGFLHRHQGTWLTIRSCSRSALMLLGVSAWCRTVTPNRVRPDLCELQESASEEARRFVEEHMMPSGWQDAVVKVYNMLEVWADESSDVARLYDIVGLLLNATVGVCNAKIM